MEEMKVENLNTQDLTKKEIWQKITKIAVRVLIYAVLVIGASFMLFPYLWMVMTSLKSGAEALSLTLQFFPTEWMWSNYPELWARIPIHYGVMNTLIVEVSVILIGTFTSTLAAFSFAKLKLRHKTFWLLFLMSGMMVPYAALMLPQYRAFQALLMTDTLWPLILPGFFGNISMMFFLIQYMKGISSAFFEAAKIDGAGYMRQFLLIMLPLVKTALAAQIIFWFVGIWNDYFAPAIYLKSWERMTLQPMMARISSTNGATNYHLTMAGAVLSSIPMFIIYLCGQKYFIESLAISGVKG